MQHWLKAYFVSRSKPWAQHVKFPSLLNPLAKQKLLEKEAFLGLEILENATLDICLKV